MSYITKSIVTILAFIWMSSVAYAAETEFFCTAPAGQAFYAEDNNPSWAVDGISNGVFRVRIADGKFVSFDYRDVRGSWVDPKNQGAEILVPAISGQPSFIVFYPDDGILETYSLIAHPNGVQLYWTSIRSRAGSGQPSKIGAYLANCA